MEECTEELGAHEEHIIQRRTCQEETMQILKEETDPSLTTDWSCLKDGREVKCGEDNGRHGQKY